MPHFEQTRLRTSGPREPQAGTQRQGGFARSGPCRLCEKGMELHLHCMICRAPLDLSTLRKTCPGECKTIFKAMRRRARSIECWVMPLGAEGKKLRLWIPKRFLGLSHTGVCGASGARGAIRKKTARVSREEAPDGSKRDFGPAD
jgi:predicted nucleic acid-binding Zn ribbon protein